MCVHRDLCAMRCEQDRAAGRMDAVWPRIVDALSRCPKGQESAFIRKILESLALPISASDSTSSMLANLKTLCQPVMSKTGDTPAAKKPRTLTKSDSCASTGSSDSVDLSALDSLSLVPKSVQKKSLDIVDKLSDDIRNELQLIHDHTLYRGVPIVRLKAAHAAYSDPKQSLLVRTVFGADRFMPIRTEMDK